MGIQLGSNFSLQAGLPLDERLVCETLEQRDNIPREVRYEGMQCYVASELQTFQLTGGIENFHWESLQPERVDGNVYVGVVEPQTNKVWVDTTAELISYAIPAHKAIFQEFRDSIKELRLEIDELKRTVQDIIDNGIVVPPPSDDEEETSDYLFLTEDGDTITLEEGGYLLQEIAVLEEAAKLLTEVGEQLLTESGDFIICE